jgi:hypothetical protein
MAERVGVSPAVLRAVLTDNAAARPTDVAFVWSSRAPRSRTMLLRMSIATKS